MRVAWQEGDQATVAAQVRALDNVDGRVVATVYAVEWRMARGGEGWRLVSGTAQALETWEVPYYP